MKAYVIKKKGKYLLNDVYSDIEKEYGSLAKAQLYHERHIAKEDYCEDEEIVRVEIKEG